MPISYNHEKKPETSGSGKPVRAADFPHTGPHTLMGKLLRNFWQPIALTSEVKAAAACRVRILDEHLTLYRGQSGQAYLIGGRCAHRCTSLHTGWVNGEELNCMYHGWRYDGTGQCVGIPAEKRARKEFPRIPGYPVREYSGLIFAYLGNTPVPEFDLPRKSVFEDGAHRVIVGKQIWDCNWFQQVENSLDAVHVSFAHLWGSVRQFGAAITTSIPDLSYTETSSGIRQVATRSSANVRVSDWIFPNNNNVIAPGPEKGDPWVHVSAWPVPVDDKTTVRFTQYAVNEAWAKERPGFEKLFELDYDPAKHADALFQNGDVSHLSEASLATAQDYVAVRGQGEIFDRSKENLSTSDAGIVFLRRLFMRELEAIRAGQPIKIWKRILDEAPAHLLAGNAGGDSLHEAQKPPNQTGLPQ